MTNMKLATLAWRSVAAGAGIGLVLMIAVLLIIQSRGPAQPPDRQVLDRPQSTTATEAHLSAGPVAQTQPEEAPRLDDVLVPIREKLFLLASQRNENLASNQLWEAYVIQPDPAIDRAFLLVSSSELTARAFNSYFSFYFNHASSPSPPYPVLILDRLFQEQNRQQTLDSGRYHEADLVHELAYWLGILVDESQAQAICDFVITCYEKDFSLRLKSTPGHQVADWQENIRLAGLEVTYHAGRETYCTFEPA
ncbi:MAG: hypothetical protein EOM70_00650 [Clostridia bacterium]|nr:hypothetical protein [Clostridia bacterium]